MHPSRRSCTAELPDIKRNSFLSYKLTQNSSYASITQSDGILDGNETASPRVRSSIIYSQNQLEKKFVLKSLCFYLKYIYERSRIHNLFPVLILFAYSLLGGFVFYVIECPNERVLLDAKNEYIEHEKLELLHLIVDIHNFVLNIRNHSTSKQDGNGNVQTNTRNLVRRIFHRNLRTYRIFALNQLDKAIYWYVLNIFYLTDHESFKMQVLQPQNPELHWENRYQTNLGRIVALKNYTQQLSLRCWEIAVEGDDDPEVIREKIQSALEFFADLTGLSWAQVPVWTFWNSMFLAVTTYTTIGYGNITAQSQLGKLAAMLYAVIGIPLVLMILHKLGHQFLRVLEWIWYQFLRLVEFLSCIRSGKAMSERFSEDSDQDFNIPPLLAVGIAFGWMFLCAAIFLKFEKNWDYFKSFYFFFCSLTTIGYGDVTPTNSEDMFVIFGLIMVGLALVSMCINVVQLKLEQLFEEFFMMMLEEYKQTGVSTKEMKVKVGVVTMWRMWKKRRKQQVAKDKNSISTSALLKFSRGRRALFEQLHRAIHTETRGTQTDYFDAISLFTGIQNICSEEWIEAAPMATFKERNQIAAKTIDNVNHEITIICEPRLPSQQLIIRDNSEESQELVTSNLVTDWNCSAQLMDEPVSLVRDQEVCSEEQLRDMSSEACSSNCDDLDCFDPRRKWAFVETGRREPGKPRGLVAHHIYTPSLPEPVQKSDIRRLLSEADYRIRGCRALSRNSDS